MNTKTLIVKPEIIVSEINNLLKIDLGFRGLIR